MTPRATIHLTNSSAKNGTSLFHRLGGTDGIMVAVVLFYEKVMVDEEVAHFFEGLDMDAQIKKQVAFMTTAFGGPHKYDAKRLRESHAPLVERGLNDAHFESIAKHLNATLVELNVSQADIDEALNVVGETREAVLGRAS